MNLRIVRTLPQSGLLAVALCGSGSLVPNDARAQCTECSDGSSNYMPSDGYVGIGTTSPDWDLEIERSGEPVSLFLTSDTDQYSGIGFTKGTSNKWYLRTVANASDLQLYNYTLATDQMFWDWDTGRVGIGTNTPGALLEVNGNIAADNPTSDTHAATKGYVDALLVENNQSAVYNGELISQIEIDSSPTGAVLFSLQVSDIATDDVIQAFSEYEVYCPNSLGALISTQIILADSNTAITGTVISEKTGLNIPSEWGLKWTFTKAGSYQATSALGSKYVNVVVWGYHPSPGGSDHCDVPADYGRLSVFRYVGQ